jgi:LmbE family N-acetylglucosaminyl deacetylase
MNARLLEDEIPVRRPHFHLKSDKLTFLISRRPYATLSSEEQAIWKAIDGAAPIGHLRQCLGDGAEAVLQRFADLAVCEVLPPSFPANRRRIVIIEPHMDDAALSVGGIMWMRRTECEFIVVTLAGISNFTSYYNLDREYFDVKGVSALRRAESELFLRHVGGRHIALDLLEAPLRYRNGDWTLGWFQQHKRSISGFYEHSPRPQELDLWSSKVARALGPLKPQEIWMPLGIGRHVDHQLTRDACLRVVGADPGLPERPAISLYQDVPYASLFPNHTPDLIRALEGAGARLEEKRVDVGHVMAKKLELLSIFASQFKMSFMGPRVEACARQAGAGSFEYAELLYKINVTRLAGLEGLSRCAGRAAIDALSENIVPWLRRNRSASLIRLLLATAAGRWAEDMQFLLEIFPRATFEVHVGSAWLAETETLASPRIRIKVVGRGWRSWLLDAVRTLASRPNPLVIIAPQEAHRRARLVSGLSIGSDSIIAPSMSEFLLTLREACHGTV